jgi:hypothetical protein
MRGDPLVPTELGIRHFSGVSDANNMRSGAYGQLLEAREGKGYNLPLSFCGSRTSLGWLDTVCHGLLLIGRCSLQFSRGFVCHLCGCQNFICLHNAFSRTLC